MFILIIKLINTAYTCMQPILYLQLWNDLALTTVSVFWTRVKIQTQIQNPKIQFLAIQQPFKT
mgnify:CR=1 FL=1